MKISIIVPVYNYAEHLEKTLKSIKEQSEKDFELIVVDDCSTDNSVEVAKRFTDNVFVKEKNSGPAVSRNIGINKAKSDIIAFVDSDCLLTEDWIKNILKGFDKEVDGVMGNTKIKKTNYIGDCISEMGFPGGANAGFERMWKVNKDGFTDHITSCNFAARKHAFNRYGMFDESFPLAGGEDPELSYRWSKQGAKIKYCKEALMFHEPKTSVKDYIKWMIYRGRSNYYFKKRVKKVGGFIKLRIWSSKNIVLKNLFSLKLPMILYLLFISFVYQQKGYRIEKKKHKESSSYKE